jgi:hypothetical protein
MIHVQVEPDEITREFRGLLEECYFCRSKTKHWHKPTNTPVCESCAKDHFVGDIKRAQRVAAAAAAP